METIAKYTIAKTKSVAKTLKPLVTVPLQKKSATSVLIYSIDLSVHFFRFLVSIEIRLLGSSFSFPFNF